MCSCVYDVDLLLVKVYARLIFRKIIVSTWIINSQWYVDHFGNFIICEIFSSAERENCVCTYRQSRTWTRSLGVTRNARKRSTATCQTPYPAKLASTCIALASMNRPRASQSTHRRRSCTQYFYTSDVPIFRSLTLYLTPYNSTPIRYITPILRITCM